MKPFSDSYKKPHDLCDVLTLKEIFIRDIEADTGTRLSLASSFQIPQYCFCVRVWVFLCFVG